VLDKQAADVAIPQAVKGLEDGALEDRVDPRQRLVEDHHAGASHDDAGELQEALLAAAEVPRELVRQLGQPELLQQLARLGPAGAVDLSQPAAGQE
jgi:hypothetical protein